MEYEVDPKYWRFRSTNRIVTLGEHGHYMMSMASLSVPPVIVPTVSMKIFVLEYAIWNLNASSRGNKGIRHTSQ